jgi:hypothetical protein
MGKGGSSPLLQRLREAFLGLARCQNITLRDAYQLASAKVRVPFEGFPIQVILGNQGKQLHLYPEYPLGATGAQASWSSFVVLDPECYFDRICGFFRVPPRGKLILGRRFADQQAAFDYPACVAGRHLELQLDGDAVVFKDLSGVGTCISPILDERKFSRIRKLERIREIYGGSIDPLPKREALALLESVIELMGEDKYRPRDWRGQPGGLVELPEKLIPIIVGDLHAQVDNLLNLLSQNAFLEGLESGEACLVLLGDAVHSELDGQMDEMESSMLIMDLILRLKARFPDRVFLIRGNHDSFAEDVSKEGIPQGLLWDRVLREVRGKAYREAMARFYDRLPYVVMSRGFAACHASPPKSRVTKKMLVDIHRYPGLIPELINNRMYRPSRPAGYTKGDVRRFRKSLGLSPDAPIIVGHTPVDRTETYWLDVGAVPDHHVVYGAGTSWVGVFTAIGGKLMPLKYPVETLRPVVATLGEDAA